ncbi:Hypothetical protein, putative [Bodo saltans]|uniref:histone acetyltransferase n=1 Tax=Bodo saltans TaxID=75058 RepID=A0A0S4KI17_BODSA|nr:Hypothetical protein, putative [Bodo saltans]|eukprot:CUI15327.1 Hypothetical protein, putative [Bodo saltans]
MKRQRAKDDLLHDLNYHCKCCLKKCASDRILSLHEDECSRVPDAPVVFQNQHLVIFEVDGRYPSNRVFAKRLVEVGISLLEQKHPLEDVQLFTFFVLYMRDTSTSVSGLRRLHFAGFFSKEHPASSTSSLACIVILDEFRGYGLGTFLAALSFALSRRSGSPATPERPLSISGQHLYASLWQRLVREHFSRSTCTSVEECSASTGVAVDDVLRALYSMRMIAVKSHHPLAFVERSAATTPTHSPPEATLIWP